MGGTVAHVAAHEIDGEVRRLLKARDLDGLWPIVHRMMSHGLKLKVRAFVAEELEAATLGRLAELYEREVTGHPWHRLDVLKSFKARLGDPHLRHHARAVVVELSRRMPKDSGLDGLLISFDAVPVERLRELAVASGRGSQSRTSLFALVRLEDHDWLEEQVRGDGLPAGPLSSLFDAAQKSSKMAKRLVRCAREMKSAKLMRHCLLHFEVDREVVEEALEYEQATVRAALMPHAHRLRNADRVLRQGLRHQDTAVRREALRVLVERPIAEAIADVEALLDDPDPYDERHNLEPIAAMAKRYLATVKR